MDFIDLNSTELDKVSASIGTETSNTEVLQGGFLWSSTGACNNNEKALLAAKRGELQVVDFMLTEGMVTDLSVTDKNGATLLHYLVPNAGNPIADKIIAKLVKSTSVKKLVNKANHAGCTPLHLAVEMERDDVADAFVNAGADMGIKDHRGRSVEKHVDVKPSSPKNTSDLLKLLPMLANLNKKSTFTPEESDELMPMTLRTVVRNSNPGQAALSPDTSDLYDKVRTSLQGGRRGKYSKIRLGTRKLNTNMNPGARRPDANLRRVVNNQATAIHDRVVETIMELRKVDKTEAKVIKAAIYSSIRENNPDLKNLDRAIEMEKSVTNEYIDGLDLDAWRKKLHDHWAEKEKASKEKFAQQDSTSESSEQAPTPSEGSMRSNYVFADRYY